ncbi:MAG: sigma-70 family RNA polymerase sigma factor [Verrucomicrobiales bacterium]|nr:sigma-70 family RNA polymerase sigma factor [Verrucomicrobiales bacterium]
MSFDRGDWKKTRASLLVRLRDKSDSASWEDFWSLYGPVVFGLVRRSVPSDEDAEDVVQEIFLRVGEAIGTFHYDPEKGRFKSWLFRLARHGIVDWLRRNRRRREGQLDVLEDLALDSMDDLPAMAADPYWKIYEEEWMGLLAGVREGVASRLPRQYQLYHLFVVKGWPMERVVAEMGVEAGYVSKAKSLVEDALQTEMRRLEQGGSIPRRGVG